MTATETSPTALFQDRVLKMRSLAYSIIEIEEMIEKTSPATWAEAAALGDVNVKLMEALEILRGNFE